MGKKLVNAFFLLQIISFSACAQTESLQETISLASDGLIVLHQASGDFNGDELLDVVIFCENPEWRYGNEVPNIDETKIVLSSGNANYITLPVEFETLGYSASVIELLDSFADSLPNWDGVASIFDYNGDGSDEILAFKSSGIGISIRIYGLANREIRNLFTDSKNDTYKLTSVSFDSKNNQILVNRVRNLSGNPESIQYRILWNSETLSFLLQE